ncbi:MAG: hypothetical protein OEU36_21085 [Gammaproteobacteria bacterium]|nr:hypothetical protein [Gammaproteobacteria bacterium]
MPSDRTVGVFFAAIFLAIGLLPLFGETPSVWRGWLLTGGIFAFVALARSSLLRPINHLWMGLGRAFNRFFPVVFLTLFYWLIFTPVGILTRLGSKKVVDLRWKAEDCESWWEVRAKPGPPPETISKQY